MIETPRVRSINGPVTYRGVRLFREQALAEYDRRPEGGNPLRLSPRYVGWTFWLLTVVATASLVFAALADLNEYAHGPAVIRMEGRSPVTAVEAGIVASLAVEPGQHVRAGEVLVRFHDAGELAQIQRLEQQIEGELTQFLRNPADEHGRRQLAALNAEADLARARLAQRAIRAPRAGVVSDTRIHSGQSIAPGQVLLTLEADDAGGTLVAMLPGHYRPLLQAGLPLELELSGFAHHHQELHIESIGDEIIGPEEVQRFLGAPRADALSLSGPLVLVRARLPERTFEVDAHHYNYFDGMQGRVEIRVRAQSILTSLIPGLDGLVHAR